MTSLLHPGEGDRLATVYPLLRDVSARGVMMIDRAKVTGIDGRRVLLKGVFGEARPPVEDVDVVVALVDIFECDSRTGIVPDVFTLVPLAILIGDSLVLHQFVMPAISALVVFTPFAIAALVTRGHGMGWGDAKLAALGGALLGMFAATLSFGIASLAAVIVTSIKHRSKAVPVAFAPYLVGAIAVSMALQAR